MENSNLYQVVKTIRFKLEPVGKMDTPKFGDKNAESKANLTPFIELVKKTMTNVKALVFSKQDGEDGEKWRKILEVNYRFLRSYLKNSFYENRGDSQEKSKKHKISDLEYLQKALENLFAEFDEILDGLEDFEKRNTKNQYEKQRHAQAGLLLNRLCKRSNFGFLKAFVGALAQTNKPFFDDKTDKLKKQIDKFETELEKQKEFFLPYQSNGVLFAGGSFNRYAINKTPKMLDKELREEQTNLKKSLCEHKIKIDTLNTLGLKNDCPCTSLDNSYTFIKDYKAKQKSKFIELVQKGEFDEAKKVNLFECSETDFETFKTRTKQIQNEKDKDERTKLKQKRGKFFKSQTQNYENLCDLYKKIAQKRGQIVAKICAIKKEKEMCEQVKYWCVALEKGGEFYLYMFLRDENDNIKNAYDFVSKLQTQKSGETKLHYFDSLTLKAVRKLCFKETDGSFKKALKNVKFPECEQNLDEKVKISFYQNVLKNAKTLNLSKFENLQSVTEGKFESLSEFEVALNMVCYTKTVCVSESVEKELKKFKPLVFHITSQDLAAKREKKAHTQIWHEFWRESNEKSKFPLRLNPELKVMWREARPSRVEKYAEQSDKFDPNKKNRYLHPQFTLALNFTQNAHNEAINLAFKDVQNKGEAVKKFNENFKSSEYAFGIDVGTKDLALLCLIDKNKKPVNFDVYEICNENEICNEKLGFEKFGFYKDGTRRDEPYKLIKNPSYFLNESLYKKTFNATKEEFERSFSELFKRKSVCALDLTTAKVICGKIILNGDFSTHLNLKILNAKRKISAKLKKDPTLKIEYDNDDNILFGSNVIFYYNNKYEIVRPYDEIKNEIFEFHEKQRLDDARLEDNINKTRANLVANMVGVISFLHKEFSGFVVLENLKQSEIEGNHRLKFEGDITRPLELALYRKFQSKCLTPPISELIKLREGEKNENVESDLILQFGIIKFVDKDKTSRLCPACGKDAYENNNSKYKTDKKDGVFECAGCGFNNKNNAGDFAALDTNDKIATFNIAKRGL